MRASPGLNRTLYKNPLNFSPETGRARALMRPSARLTSLGRIAERDRWPAAQPTNNSIARGSKRSAYVKYGKDERVREWANQIIMAQEAEIAAMQDWLKQHVQ